MKKAKVCLRCGSGYTDFPALSRRDNKTDICSDCGREEAMVDFGLRSKSASNCGNAVEREIIFMRKLLKK